MAGFIRRFSAFPSTQQITQIEGVVIVDLPPPGSVQGVGSGVVAIVGEFADMASALLVSAAGLVSTNARPVEITSGQDMLNKVGGFDETLGNFGAAMGNGFVEVRGKKFSRLVLVPVNLCSAAAIRLFRSLPTCTSATDPTPVVPIQSAAVAAGREFKSGANRVRIGTRVVFADTGAFVTGVDGVMAAAAASATQPLDSASSTFVTDGVAEGDVVTVGVLGTHDPLNTLTFRVSSVASETQLVLELLSGVNFANAVEVALPFRVHQGNVADTGPENQASEVPGYIIPARPLDATIAADTALTPTVVPPALTATGADPLSGLAAHTDPTTGLVFLSAVQAPNAPNSANIDALYQAAFDSLLTEEAPARDVNILVSARKSSTIRAAVRGHVLTASQQGIGRIACISSELTTLTPTAATADADPGVGANRAERVFYSWPGARISIPEAVGALLNTSDGKTTDDGILDLTGDTLLASVLSNLPPERNPGQASAPVPAVLAGVLGLQRGVSGLLMNDYILMRQAGIAGLRIDRSVGPIFQSGITTSLTSGQKNINRRRMADFIQDSLSQRYVQFSKLPLTPRLEDTIVTETDAFLSGLLSENNPPAQRILDFNVDPLSGNTVDSKALGIFAVIVTVQTLATADFIVLQVSASENGIEVTEI